MKSSNGNIHNKPLSCLLEIRFIAIRISIRQYLNMKEIANTQGVGL